MSASGDGGDDGDFVVRMEEFVAMQIDLVTSEARGFVLGREIGKGPDEKSPEFALVDGDVDGEDVAFTSGRLAALGEEEDFHSSKVASFSREREGRF